MHSSRMGRAPAAKFPVSIHLSLIEPAWSISSHSHPSSCRYQFCISGLSCPQNTSVFAAGRVVAWLKGSHDRYFFLCLDCR